MEHLANLSDPTVARLGWQLCGVPRGRFSDSSASGRRGRLARTLIVHKRRAV